jgi:hypothetical protein
MNLAAVEKIVRAVLYEGYMLYPYRPSSLKNQQRWNFGVLYPASYSQSQGGADPFLSRTECLVQAAPECRLEIDIRFLHLIERSVGKIKTPAREGDQVQVEPLQFDLVDRLEVGGKVFQPWQEAEERNVLLSFTIRELLAGVTHTFTFKADRRVKPVRDESAVRGVIIRQTQTVAGLVEVFAEQRTGGVIKLTVVLRNVTPFADPEHKSRDQALTFSLLSAHVVLGITGGEFVSLLEPPDGLRDLAAGCHNVGVWPVLVGSPGQRDTMLSSPIILYDYPQVAPESAGDLFDSSEIDEILSLRILTMTDEEKREMRESDERARKLLERTEALPPEQLIKLHGAVRSMRSLDKEGS